MVQDVRTLQVQLEDRSYPIYIGRQLISGRWFREAGVPAGRKLLLVTDEHVGPHYLNLWTEALEEAGYRVFTHTVPAGEASKSLQTFEDIITFALECGLDRNSVIVALGGGVIGDLAGYVAAAYMRGIPYVQIPTTLLAHDSSVGGKVAINHPQAKNMIGAFHQPLMVIYDVDTLKTLPQREISNGMAEMVKHGLIGDVELVDLLEQSMEDLLQLSPDGFEDALEKAIAVKVAVVSQDERENGLRAILNYGHTLGHAIEALSHKQGEPIIHGEAVSIGMIGAAQLGVRYGCDSSIVERTRVLLQRAGLPTILPRRIDADSILRIMAHDKKFKDNQAVFILPKGIGEVYIQTGVPIQWVRETIDQLYGEV
jgi:3-dehydroquinate synthase